MKFFFDKAMFSALVIASALPQVTISSPLDVEPSVVEATKEESTFEFEPPVSFDESIAPKWRHSDTLPPVMGDEMITIDYTNNPFEKSCPNGFVIHSFGGSTSFKYVLPSKLLTYVELYCLKPDKSSSSFVTGGYVKTKHPVKFDYIITNVSLKGNYTHRKFKPTLIANGSIATYSSKDGENNLYNTYDALDFSEHVLGYTSTLIDLMHRGLAMEEKRKEVKNSWKAIKPRNINFDE